MSETQPSKTIPESTLPVAPTQFLGKVSFGAGMLNFEDLRQILARDEPDNTASPDNFRLLTEL